MFLSDKDILKSIKAGDIQLDGFEPKRLQPASYDIRLGNTFIVNEAHSTTAIDPVKGVYPKTTTIDIKDGEEFVLHPGVSILGYSKERFGSQRYLIEVNGKSSLARIGLIVHNSASIVNPGHYLNIALELCNLNNVPIILRPGMEIAQLTFSTISSDTKRTYETNGRYHTNNFLSYIPPKAKRPPKAKDAKPTKKK